MIQVKKYSITLVLFIISNAIEQQILVIRLLIMCNDNPIWSVSHEKAILIQNTFFDSDILRDRFDSFFSKISFVLRKI